MSARPRNASLLERVRHGLIRRSRLLLAASIGILVAVFLPGAPPVGTRSLIGWNVGALFYLVWSWSQMLRADLHAVRRHATDQDEAEWAVLVISLMAALASIGAIVVELNSAPDDKVDAMRLALAAGTIIVSWFFVHTAIALHYARMFYGTGGTPPGGFDFPKTDEPDYLDFLYFSFTIGAAAQTSDVAVTTRPMRRMVLFQTILAFLFNTSILALAINIGGSLK